MIIHFGFGLNWKEMLICVFGGLRGALGLAMDLLVEEEEGIDEETRYHIAHTTSVASSSTMCYPVCGVFSPFNR